MWQSEDFSNIREGDQIFISSRRVQKLAVVERTTPTLIVVDGARFLRKNGRETGVKSNARYLHLASTQRFAQEQRTQERQNIQNKVKKLITTVDLSTLDDKQLSNLIEVLKITESE